MDEYPEAAFFNVGTIEDVKAKAGSASQDRKADSFLCRRSVVFAL